MKTKVILWLFYFSITVLTSEVLKVKSKNVSPEINNNHSYITTNHKVLKENFKIDYKTVYKLRFNPTTLNRDENRNAQNSLEIINKPKIQNLTAGKIYNYLNAQTRNGSLNAISYNNQTSNIMKPQQAESTLSMIDDRLKNLLFGQPTNLEKSQGSGKGLLNLFEVIQFENTECNNHIKGIRHLNGTCYHRFECVSLGGAAVGSCANGYGVCCIFKYTCGMTTKQSISYFESPKFPLATKEPLTCVFTLKLASNIRQVRLDFLFFELRRPTDGDCIEDQFQVSGQNSNFKVPIICGINTGQHLYIDVDNSPEKKIHLSILGRTEGARAFNIRILQVKTDKIAPANCLQYYTDPHGEIKSFNYDETGNVIESRVAQYLNNLNYAICIKKDPAKCYITYTNEFNNNEFPFEMVNVDEDGNSLVPSGQAGVTIYNCPDDFIVINAVRLCGYKLNDGRVIEDFTQNAPVTDFGNGPMILQVRTNGQTVGRGFKLVYYQEACI